MSLPDCNRDQFVVFWLHDQFSTRKSDFSNMFLFHTNAKKYIYIIFFIQATVGPFTVVESIDKLTGALADVLSAEWKSFTLSTENIGNDIVCIRFFIVLLNIFEMRSY